MKYLWHSASSNNIRNVNTVGKLKNIELLKEKYFGL